MAITYKQLSLIVDGSTEYRKAAKPRHQNKVTERIKRQAYLDENYPATIWKNGVPFVFHSSLCESLQTSSFWQCYHFSCCREERNSESDSLLVPRDLHWVSAENFSERSESKWQHVPCSVLISSIFYSSEMTKDAGVQWEETLLKGNKWLVLEKAANMLVNEPGAKRKIWGVCSLGWHPMS